MLLPGPRIAATVKRGGALPVLAVLCVQALLLFHNLDLLPIWGDELFTLRTVAQPVSEIIPIVQRDIHPPLYYLLLHEWMRLPLPWSGITALRAFSVVAALLSTLLLDRLWLRRWRTERRSLALALFAFSPCLLLYGRMARSYAMQTALGLLAVSLLWRWMREPTRITRRALPAFAAAVLLLYTHYLPGIAILAAFSLVAWRRLGLARVALFSVAVAAAYAPWLVTLAGALRGWGEAAALQSHYALSRSLVAEQGLKIAAAAVSLTIGESFSVFSLALVPVALLLIWSACRIRALGPSLLPFLWLAAAIGYAGATSWVAWPFVAARLLWVLPFLTMALAIGLTRRGTPLRHVAAAALLISFASSAMLYFRRENFVNLGYTAPLREIAARIKAEAAPRDLVLVDAYNADSEALRFYLGDTIRFRSVMADTAPEARQAAPGASAVWVVRNTRDVSPGHLVSALEAAACHGRTQSQTFYEPYLGWERIAISIATGGAPPEYFYQVTVCR